MLSTRGRGIQVLKILISDVWLSCDLRNLEFVVRLPRSFSVYFHVALGSPKELSQFIRVEMLRPCCWVSLYVVLT